MMKNTILVMLAMVLVISLAQAEPTVWYVHPDSALNTIQAALDSCADSDIVLVGPGTYYENLDWPNTQGIHLVSELGPTMTVIDGSEATHVIACSTGVDTTTLIQGFTIQDGWTSAPYGGGILCYNNSSPKIAGNTITNNYGGYHGGGIMCDNSSPKITGNTVSNNMADYGGGICCRSASPTIADNIITENEAPGYNSGGGGGIYCADGSAPIIRDNTITHNTTSGYFGSSGGGIHCYDSSPIIINNRITNNTAHGGWSRGRGGGIYFWQNCTATIDSCTIANNDSGGIYCTIDSELEIHHCNIFDNAGYGMINASAGIMIDAESNWWGHATGPFHPDSNPGGLGDSVSDYVDFRPWLTEPVGVKEKEIIEVERRASSATIFSGLLRLPEGKRCRVFDITGRVVAPDKIRPGIYFIEVDGEITQKVVKVK